MSAYSPRHCVTFQLHHSGPWPDGPVPIPLNGNDLLQRVGVEGLLDIRSFRLSDLDLFPHEWGRDEAERAGACQFEPGAEFDAETNPVGTLWIRLWRYPWEAASFPRHFRLHFDTLRGGGHTSSVPLPAHLPAQPELVYHVADSRIVWLRDSVTPVLAWNTPPGAKPHFHPVTTPDGRLLSHDAPRDHIWHHGLMFGWTSIRCPEKALKEYTFWAEPCGGKIAQDSPESWQTGPVWSGFTQNLTWHTHAGLPVFSTEITTRYARIEAAYDWIDLDVTLRANSAPVTFSSDYGHLKCRMNLAFEQPEIVTADERFSAVDMLPAKPMDWIGFDGLLEGKPAGLLLLNHPENPGGQPSGDGSCARRTLPLERGDLFGWIGLNPFRLQAQTLSAHETLRLRYRAVLTSQRLEPDLVRLMVAGFASRATAEWV